MASNPLANVFYLPVKKKPKAPRVRKWEWDEGDGVTGIADTKREALEEINNDPVKLRTLQPVY